MTTTRATEHLPYLLASFISRPNWIAAAVTLVAAAIVLLRPEAMIREPHSVNPAAEQRSRLAELLDPVTYPGFSSAESWGRWSDGKVAQIHTQAGLPVTFDLWITGHAFGPNIGVPIEVCIGGECQNAAFGAAPTTLVFRFRSVDADAIAFHIPYPTSPKSLARGSDPRLLGLALQELKIEEVP